MRNRPYPGFTLVELLVVISIIGILISLSVPAVLAAREAMNRSKCGSNLGQLGVAANHFATTHDEMPGYLQRFGEFGGGSDPTDPGNYGGNVPPHVKVGGWPVALMSKLDNQPAYERWSLDRYPVIAGPGGERTPTPEGYSVFAAVNLDTFMCPSATGGIARNGINHYVANNGMHADRFPFQYQRPGSNQVTVTFARSMSASNGVFGNRYAGTDPADPSQRVATAKPFRLDDCKDGASGTLLFSENNQALPTYRTSIVGNTSHLTTLSPVGSPASAGNRVGPYPPSSRYTQGAVWHFEDPSGFALAPPVRPIVKINGGDVYNLLMTPANLSDVARPSSLHTGGVNVAMMDSSVRFVTDSIDYRIYQAMMTPKGRTSDVPQNEFIPVASF